MSETRRVVAVQLAVRLGEVERNLAHIEDIVGQAAREHSPDMIFLPEVSTTPNLNHRVMKDCVRPVDGAPLALYRRLAREHGCIVGAGALTIRGRDARNTYFVCEPDGAVHLHDKDQPTMWENATYGPGSDPGILAARRRADRLRRTASSGRARAPPNGCAGACGSSPAACASPRSRRGRRRGPTSGTASTRRCSQLARETPGRMARVVGAPAVHASHVGDVVMETPFAPWRRRGRRSWSARRSSPTRDGAILQRLAYEDGEGYVCADVRLGGAARRATRCRRRSG